MRVPMAMRHSVRIGFNRVDPWSTHMNVDDRLSPRAAKSLLSRSGPSGFTRRAGAPAEDGVSR